MGERKKHINTVFSGEKWVSWQSRLSKSNVGLSQKRQRRKLSVINPFSPVLESNGVEPSSPSRSKLEKKHSLTFMAKEFLMSKSVSSSFGRTILKSFIGQRGIPILDSLVEISRYHIGEKLANHLHK